MKSLTRKFNPRIDTVKADDGAVLCESDEVKQRWKQYCYNRSIQSAYLTHSLFSDLEPARFNLLEIISAWLFDGYTAVDIDGLYVSMTQGTGQSYLLFLSKSAVKQRLYNYKTQQYFYNLLVRKVISDRSNEHLENFIVETLVQGSGIFFAERAMKVSYCKMHFHVSHKID